jgi:uncharacterized protein (TIGR03000 family)
MTTKWFSGLIFVTVLGMSVNQAFAGHHHHHGGSYGSYGSSGGSYGSYGSNGGSYGSSGGSYGSSGGSWGYSGDCYSSSGGSWGSYGSNGSSGGSYGSYGGGGVAYSDYAYTSAAPTTAVVAAADTTQGHLSFNVPSEAIVYLVNQRMTLTGTVRNYIIPGLQAGRQYRYPVRVDLVRDGKLYRAAADLQLQAGQQLNLAFNENAGQSQIVVAQN